MNICLMPKSVICDAQKKRLHALILVVSITCTNKAASVKTFISNHYRGQYSTATSQLQASRQLQHELLPRRKSIKASKMSRVFSWATKHRMTENLSSVVKWKWWWTQRLQWNILGLCAALLNAGEAEERIVSDFSRDNFTRSFEITSYNVNNNNC